jgi:biotin carboxyl carrier protein
MSSQPTSAKPSRMAQKSEPGPKPRRRMSTGNRILFFVTAWLIVLMPFLFWWNTWFGRQLSGKQLNEYLHDEKHPRHIQHALVQIGERMARNDSQVKQSYPELLRLADYPVEEVRNTDAWVMGQDTSAPGFHEALLKMLNDQSPMVRGNAALSLVRFGDATGRSQIVSLLQPATITAPLTGTVVDADKVGTPVHQGGIVAKLKQGDQSTEVRSPITGRLRSVSIEPGKTVAQGTEIAQVDPGTEQVWEALRALYLIGKPEDLPTVTPYERELPEVPDRIRQQAVLTEKAIRDRSAR